MIRTLLAVAVALQVPCSAVANPVVVWRFDNLKRIGGLPVKVEGQPRVVRAPGGKALEFDGLDDAIYLARHPLAGASQFTAEAIIRPEGGAFEQRWMHLASNDPVDQTRIMFEIRVVANGWYLDTFVTGKGYRQTLVDPAKLHPIGPWYHVAQTFDGTTYRSYVNGLLESEAKVAFTAQAPGNTSIGTRYDKRNYFKGAIKIARFTPRALPPARFLSARN